jgi:hypothetical protein
MSTLLTPWGLALANIGRETLVTSRQVRRRDGVKQSKPVSGRIGRDVVVSLNRHEVLYVGMALATMLAAWPKDVQSPAYLIRYAIKLHKSIERRGKPSINLRLPKQEAASIGRLLMENVDIFADGLKSSANYPRQAVILLCRAGVKMLVAGVSRPGNRSPRGGVDVHPVTEWRRKKRPEAPRASSILLGK